MATAVEAIIGAVHLDGGDVALDKVMVHLGLSSHDAKGPWLMELPQSRATTSTESVRAREQPWQLTIATRALEHTSMSELHSAPLSKGPAPGKPSAREHIPVVKEVAPGA